MTTLPSCQNHRYILSNKGRAYYVYYTNLTSVLKYINVSRSVRRVLDLSKLLSLASRRDTTYYKSYFNIIKTCYTNRGLASFRKCVTCPGGSYKIVAVFQSSQFLTNLRRAKTFVFWWRSDLGCFKVNKRSNRPFCFGFTGVNTPVQNWY